MTSTAHPDLGPAVEQVKELLTAVTDDHLAVRTPCEGTPVAGLIDHLMGLALAFRMAAEKQIAGAGGPSSSADDLDPAWRQLLPERLDELAAAWRSPQAWEGEAEAGGTVMPAQVMGVVALDEVVLHGWDLARATGQAYEVDAGTAEVLLPFLQQSASDEGTPGLFGPQVHVAAGASPLDRLVGLSGRDPAWPGG